MGPDLFMHGATSACAQAAADTLALGSLEVDISGVQEGETMTVKWRGKPVFIKYRTEEDIAAQAATPLSDLKDPQRDIDRVLDPKVSFGSVGGRLD